MSSTHQWQLAEHPQSCLSKLRLLKHLLLCVALSGITPIQHANSNEAEQVLKSWVNRPLAIESFSYDCEVKETKVVPDNADIFSERISPQGWIQTPEMRSYLTFCSDRGRLARTSTGEVWDGDNKKVMNSTFKATFDGSVYKTLLLSKIAHGTIEKTSKAGEQLIVNTKLIPFWLSHSPKSILEELGYQCGDMRLENEPEKFNGKQCSVLVVPRGNSAWKGFIYVDPSKDNLPVRFLTVFEGDYHQDISIKYTRYASSVWALSEWKAVFYSESAGFINRTITCKVKSASINEPLKDKSFELEFPANVELTLLKNGKPIQFKQSNNDELSL